MLQLLVVGVAGAAVAPLVAACGNDETDNNVDLGHSGPGVTETVPSFTPISSATPAPSATATATASAPGTGPNFTVQMSDQFRFQPDNLTIPRGATVTWKNAGSAIHTTTDDPTKAAKKDDAVLPTGAQPWDSGFLTSGKSWSRVFDVPGKYTYFCIPHESMGMIGHITVQG